MSIQNSFQGGHLFDQFIEIVNDFSQDIDFSIEGQNELKKQIKAGKKHLRTYQPCCERSKNFYTSILQKIKPLFDSNLISQLGNKERNLLYNKLEVLDHALFQHIEKINQELKKLKLSDRTIKTKNSKPLWGLENPLRQQAQFLAFMLQEVSEMIRRGERV